MKADITSNTTTPSAFQLYLTFLRVFI